MGQLRAQKAHHGRRSRGLRNHELLRSTAPSTTSRKKRTKWTDQLSINQDDIEERIVQVRLMGDIYSNCSQCIIWMEEINSNLLRADVESIVEVLGWMADRSLAVPSCLASCSSFHGPTKALESIGVGKHPWWSRIWTVQEAVLPSKKTLLWGSIQIPWETVTRAAHT